MSDTTVSRGALRIKALPLADALDIARSEPTVDPRTAARLIGVGEETIYSAAQKGQFGAFKIAGRYRFQSKLVLAAIGEAAPVEIAA